MRTWILSTSLAVFFLVGCSGGGTGTSSPPPQTAATPTLSPAPGIFTTGQSVTLADSTTGTTIYYTTDGTTPTASSSTYTSPIPFTVDTTINAIAVAQGYTNSSVAQGLYQVARPIHSCSAEHQ